jgi:hypothetical protein
MNDDELSFVSIYFFYGMSNVTSIYNAMDRLCEEEENVANIYKYPFPNV